MNIRAYAKINIGLDIVGIRADGYHLVDMIMQTVDLYDELNITPRDDGKVVLICDDPDVPTDAKNLAYKAARALLPEGDKRGVTIDLCKNIPSQAGLGGGSSDAASALVSINLIYGLGKTDEELERIGAGIGADVPFFIRGGCQRCTGIGEILSPADHSYGSFVIIVKPDAGVSTKEIYAAYDRLEKKPKLPNVLEAVTAEKCPEITEIKERLLSCGASFASMSGSGTAVFGIFSKEPAKETIESLKRDYRRVYPVKVI